MKKFFTSLLFFLFASLIFNAFGQNVIYVNHAAIGANTGTSWADAYTDLQDVLPANDGDTIWVAQGTYTPDEFDGNPVVTFFIGNNIQLLGGFNADTGERNPEMYETILSGDLNGDDENDNFDDFKSDNVFTVVTVHTAITNATLIDGFTIHSGYANGDTSGAAQYGGGIYCSGAPIIQNCIFEQNFAKNRGGGLYLHGIDANTAVVKDCLFQDNAQSHPGDTGSAGAIYIQTVGVEGVQVLNSTFTANKGIYVGAISAIRTNLYVDSCTFTQNSSSYQGGAIRYRTDNPNRILSVKNSLFEDNSAAFGGGIYAYTEADNTVIEIINSDFGENSTTFPVDPTWGSGGGGIRVLINAQIENTNISLTQCTFENNTTEGSGGGLSIINNGNFTNAAVKNCSFSENESIYHGGGLRYLAGETASHSNMMVDSCTFSLNHNEMWTGGGFRAVLVGSNSNLSLSNSIFTENTCGFGGGGAGIYGFNSTSSGSVDVFNNIFDNNIADYDGGLSIGSGTDAGYFEYSASQCTFTNNHSRIDGGGLGFYNERPAKYSVEDCFIEGNTSDGAYGGLVIYNTSPGMEAIVKNCYILNNDGDFGAAIGGYPFPEEPEDFNVTNEAKIVFENCLVAGNTGTGGSVHFKQIGNVNFNNCTIAENPAGGILLDSTSLVTLKNTILYNPGSQEYEDLTGTSSIISLGGNLLNDNSIPTPHDHDLLGENPLFVGIDDFHLNDDSPAIDNGMPCESLEFDIEGNAIVHCIDIGAYQSSVSTGENCIVSTKEIIFQELAVYPNPVNTYLQIDLPEQSSQDLNITIESIKGEALKNQIIRSGQSIDVTDLVPGMYFLRVEEGSVSYFSRFVKI